MDIRLTESQQLPWCVCSFCCVVLCRNELGTATDVWFGLLQSAFIAGTCLWALTHSHTGRQTDTCGPCVCVCVSGLSVSSLVFGHLLHYFSGFWLMGVGLTMWSCAGKAGHAIHCTHCSSAHLQTPHP